MNTTLLKTFVTVVNKKSLSLAAQELHITQPAVSKHISALEEYFSTGLIERRGRRVSLTPAGEILYNYANKILNILTKAENDIRELSSTVKGRLVIAASSIPGHYILPYIIGEFKKKYPEVLISLHISDSKNVLKLLLDETAHLGAVGEKPDNKKLNWINFFTDELVVITPPDHPFANRNSITLEELSSERLIWREPGSGTRSVLEKKLSQSGLSFDDLNIVMEMGSTGAVVNAVEAGLGISIVSEWAIQKEKQLKKIEALKISNVNMKRELFLTYPKKRYQNRVVQAFLEFVKSHHYALPSQ